MKRIANIIVATAVFCYAIPFTAGADCSASNLLTNEEYDRLNELCRSHETALTDDGLFSYKVNRDPFLCSVITDYHGDGGDVVIPDVIGKVRTTDIELDLSGRDDITSLNFEGTSMCIARTDKMSFEGCENLRTLTVHEGFSEKLIEVYLSHENEDWRDYKTHGLSLPDFCFKDCTSLESINFYSDGNCKGYSIGEDCFKNCTSLTRANIDDVDTIAPFAFLNCDSLKKVVFNENVGEIGEYAFGYIEEDIDVFRRYEGITIYGYGDTPAETYALENDIPFVNLADKQYGDANCDGEVNIADATAIIQAIGNPDRYALSVLGAKNADCYNPGDGVTGLDAMAVQELEAKNISSLPKIVQPVTTASQPVTTTAYTTTVMATQTTEPVRTEITPDYYDIEVGGLGGFFTLSPGYPIHPYKEELQSCVDNMRLNLVVVQRESEDSFKWYLDDKYQFTVFSKLYDDCYTIDATSDDRLYTVIANTISGKVAKFDIDGYNIPNMSGEQDIKLLDYNSKWVSWLSVADPSVTTIAGNEPFPTTTTQQIVLGEYYVNLNNFRFDTVTVPLNGELDLDDLKMEVAVYGYNKNGIFINESSELDYTFSVGSGKHSDCYTYDISEVDTSEEGEYMAYVYPKAHMKETFVFENSTSKNLPNGTHELMISERPPIVYRIVVRR